MSVWLCVPTVLVVLKQIVNHLLSSFKYGFPIVLFMSMALNKMITCFQKANGFGTLSPYVYIRLYFKGKLDCFK